MKYAGSCITDHLYHVYNISISDPLWQSDQLVTCFYSLVTVSS